MLYPDGIFTQINEGAVVFGFHAGIETGKVIQVYVVLTGNILLGLNGSILCRLLFPRFVVAAWFAAYQ